jgi:hypothetical protein
MDIVHCVSFLLSFECDVQGLSVYNLTINVTY